MNAITTGPNPAETVGATVGAETLGAGIVGADAVLVLRGQIDALDAGIVRLVAERARLSARIQTARINAGGTRVELGRERVILDTYRGGLGPHGAQLADAVLQVCRGTR